MKLIMLAALLVMLTGCTIDARFEKAPGGPTCIETSLTQADRMGETCYIFSKNPTGKEPDGTQFSRACRREIEAYRLEREGCK